MKSEKGITLISLIIYVIALTIVIGIVAVISGYFYNNIATSSEDIEPMVEYTKFNSFFSEEVNEKGIKVLDCKTTTDNTGKIDTSYIVFDNGVQYTYISGNKGIYRNKVKIARGIENCSFEYKVEDGKDIVNVNFKAKNMNNPIKYTLKK